MSILSNLAGPVLSHLPLTQPDQDSQEPLEQESSPDAVNLNEMTPYIIGAFIALVIQWLSGGKLKLPFPLTPQPQPQPQLPQPQPQVPQDTGFLLNRLLPQSPVAPSPSPVAPLPPVDQNTGSLVPIIVAALSALLPKILEEVISRFKSGDLK